MSRRHGALLVLAAALVWLPAAARAELSAAVEPRFIDELDTARLTIRQTGTAQPQPLDLEALEQDFDVLGIHSDGQYRPVNGEMRAWVDYRIMLRPRRAGELTIPPIKVGGETTETLVLQVRGLAPEVRETIDNMVFFETELATNPVYVQSQTVMVRRLYYASNAQIYSDLPGAPQLADAIVIPLGDTTSTTTLRNGRRYGVIEQRFAILPEQSGELIIPPIAVTSSLRIEQDGRVRRSGVRIASDPLTVQVLPIPPEYPADHPWLPAEDLTLVDRWSPADARAEVGQPLTRTLVARIEGNVSSAIPPLDPSLPEAHFRRYPEPPSLEDDTSGATVRGVREQSYAIMPTTPGTVDVPATEVVWWDVNAGEVRTARTPGRLLRIAGTAVRQPGDTSGPAGAPEPAPPAPDEAPDPAADRDVRSEQVGPDRRRATWLTVLGVVAAAVVIAWLVERVLAARRSAQARTASRRECWRALKNACGGGKNARGGGKKARGGGDPAAIHQALHDYLRAHYRAPVTESVQRFRAAGHGDVLDALNAARYRPAGRTQVDGDEVLAAVRDLRGGHRREPEPLPALYD